jgi:glycosyltransferase involved in cell wall biosynthesis
MEDRPHTERLRVLQFIDSLIGDGTERSLVTLAPRYRDLGVELHIAHLRAVDLLAADAEAGGAVVHHLAGPERRTTWVRQARRLIRDVEPHMVHTSLYEADLVGRAAASMIDVPVVSSFVTDAYGPEHVGNPEYRRWKVRAAQAVDMASARRVDRFHAVSHNAAELMSRRLRIARDRIEVVHRGRDPELLGSWSEERRQETRARIGIAPDRPLVLSVGRHYHVKGLDIVVGAFSEVLERFPEAILYLAGRDGPATSELVSIARSTGAEPSVVFAGYREDVPDLLVAADVFVLPSRAEGSPGALIEAMALRAAAVASDIPSVREVFGTPPTGLLVPLDDRNAMAEAVGQLLSDEGLRADKAATGHRRFTEQYTIDQVARDLMLVYARAAAARGQHGIRERFEQAASVPL